MIVTRRAFIAVLCAAAWPVVGRAQQSERVRRIAAIIPYADSDQEYQLLMTAFADELQKLGWRNEQNVHLEFRWTGGAIDRMQISASELVGLTPDVILGITPPVLQAVRDRTSTIPIVFLSVGDPIGCSTALRASRSDSAVATRAPDRQRHAQPPAGEDSLNSFAP